MKRVFACILAVALVFALAACGGGQTAGSTQQDSSAVQSGAASADAQTPGAPVAPLPPVGSDVPVEPAPPVGSDVPVEPAPPVGSDVPAEPLPPVSSDVPVEPIPPVGDVSVPPSDGGNGTIDEAVKPENYKLTDSGVKNEAYYETYTLDNITYQDVLNYEEKLTAQGFCIQYGAYGSETEADSLAYEVKYRFQPAGQGYKINPEDPGTLTVTVSARDLSRYNLPSLPEGDWHIDDSAKYGWVMHKLNSTVNCSKAERVALAKSYVEALKGAGYTLNAEEHPEGKEGNYVKGYIPYYYYYAEDGETRSVEVVVCTTEEGDYYRLKGIEDWSKIEITFQKEK